MSVSDEIIKTIKYAIEKNNIGCDKTFPSVVKKPGMKSNTYIILDESGQERNVKCCIPDIPLAAGTHVWVKMPRGKLKDMHICGIL